MNAQCNSCGGFNDINKCTTCFTLVCARCSTNHEQGCGQAAEMKRKGQGPTVYQSAVAETVRHNPVAPIDQKVVVDAPAWYAPTGERTVLAVDTATGLTVLDAPFSFEIAAVEPVQEAQPVVADAPVAFVPCAVQADGSISGQCEPVRKPLSFITPDQYESVKAQLGEPTQQVETAVGVSPEAIPAVSADGSGSGQCDPGTPTADVRSSEPANEVGEIPYNAIERV